MNCTFEKAWVGPCGLVAGPDGRCDAHRDAKCASCGEPATHECDHTYPMVCGAPLCEACTGDVEPTPGAPRYAERHVHRRKGTPEQERAALHRAFGWIEEDRHE